jgi:hypothetical protein
LKAEDVDWNDHTISYRRQKTCAVSRISFGNEAAGALKELPNSGFLFPAVARIHHNHRAKMFIKRSKTVGVLAKIFWWPLSGAAVAGSQMRCIMSFLAEKQAWHSYCRAAILDKRN